MKKLKIGDKVVRGPDWKWENQDCDKTGRKTEGTVLIEYFNDIYRVLWATGGRNLYKYNDEVKDIKKIVKYEQEELDI